LCDPADYNMVACEIEKGSLSSFTLRTLAAKAFARTRDYDTAIAAWFAESIAEEPSSGSSIMQDPRLSSFGTTAGDAGDETPGSVFSLVGRVERMLRYGENPHQKAFFVLPAEISAGQLSKEIFTLFKEPVLSAEPIISTEPILEKRSGQPDAIGQTKCDSASGFISGPLGGHVLGGKELSYNNLLDLDAAWRAVLDFEAPAAVIVKHLSPCGAAEANSLREAYEAALACDPVSAFGGIVALNRRLDSETALALKELFIECIAAPGFDEAGLEILRAKKNLRLIEADPFVFLREARELRSAAGGLLVQEQDRGDPIDTKWSVVGKRQPTAAELEALRFAWKLVRHVRSNAIVLAAGRAAVGIGGGQTNRVDAVKQACERAGGRARGSALASDAYFPFGDSIEAAAEAGVAAVVQPGGSVRDAEVLAAADKLGIAMVYTGVRHFRH
jgi:phosphoribosylaminoimidazolecarboxamide formyltransferase/IMP cyclohydrolase